jgi:hypothetical protein
VGYEQGYCPERELWGKSDQRWREDEPKVGRIISTAATLPYVRYGSQERADALARTSAALDAEISSLSSLLIWPLLSPGPEDLFLSRFCTDPAVPIRRVSSATTAIFISSPRNLRSARHGR